MPVMSDQMREARAERLLMLRFEKKLSPSAAWRRVRPTSKAGDKQAAELTRRDIRWLRSRRETAADGAGDDPTGATVTVGEAAEVVLTEGAAAVPPKKRCVGVEDDNPCARTISRRRTRCVACRKERRRILRKRYNRGYYRRRKERRIREAEKRNALGTLAVALRLVLERRQEEAAEREREAATAARRAADRRAGQRMVAELKAILKADEEKRCANMARMIDSGPGYNVIRHPDGRREYNHSSGYSKILKPSEPVPRPEPRFADNDVVPSPPPFRRW